jgi:hypothetical protein
MIKPLWEWAVLREPRNRPVGLCATEHAAMEALSKALVAAGRPARGQVGQVTLIRPIQADPAYLRQPPERTAVYDGTAIQWH